MFNRKVASIKNQSFTGSLLCSEKVPKIHKKTQESLFQIRCTVWTCNFIKKEIPHRSFPVNFRKFFRTAFLQGNSWRLSLSITTLFSFMIGKKGMHIYQIYIYKPWAGKKILQNSTGITTHFCAKQQYSSHGSIHLL